MREQIQQRLEALQQEFETGKQTLAGLDAKREEVSLTMMRIRGAIQVLSELLETQAGG